MLMFVSDLHLADHAHRGSFDSRAFKTAIEARLDRTCEADTQRKLVLLGDIAELLKSDLWIDERVRPWSPPSSNLDSVALAILNRIAARNVEFFEVLKALHRERGLCLAYVPGNHDGLLADPAISGLRARWRELVPGLEGEGDEPFKSMLIDFDHGVVAEHGHQLDPFNLPAAPGSRYVPGDAVVIELLVELPRLVAKKFGATDEEVASAQYDERLMFLHELDNVLPQNLSGMMRWLESSVCAMPRPKRLELEARLSASLRICARELRGTMKANHATKFERRVIRALISHACFTRANWLRVLGALPFPSADKSIDLATRLAAIGGLSTPLAREVDLYVTGHTHATSQQGFGLAKRRMTYLNTGTWRRVHMQTRSFRGIGFHEFYEETLLCVNPLPERKAQGRYEFLRYVRGT